MQSKCLYRISSLYEKRIDTTGEESIGSKFGVEMLIAVLVIESKKNFGRLIKQETF